MARGKLDSDMRLIAALRNAQKGAWATSTEVDANGSFSVEGLDPGEYEVSIYDDMRSFSETKRVIVNKDSETRISFVIDLSTIKKRD
jgi:hypothetical protein